MAIIKCKMCGGSLDIAEGVTVAECEYCGTKQTLPRIDSDRKANLYDRANHFRRNNDFDKAMGIYESILNEDSTDAEAYWSLVLCRYGIEYVEDPASHKRVPTVNRAQFTSIFDDEDYKAALKNADTLQRSVYEAEAAAINEIQKGILEISAKEEPFDCFISFKETGADGRRTRDAVLAQDLYNELTKEGFKVFFAPVTLEDKLGTAYEPYIFAALNSSKVMVVLGTKPEHFNAVWVKNEWSRYLALIKGGAKKTLIPAYRDMDPYDLPEEFSHLMAQDMSKLGFMQDLIRGIKKLIGTEEPKQVVKETVVQTTAASNTAPLIKRAFMFLEDGNWSEADAYCEKVLDIDPENAEAYLGKLMAEVKIKYRSTLKNAEQPFDGSSNYKKAVRFGDEKLTAELKDCITHIKERNEAARIEKIYDSGVKLMSCANSEEEFKTAAAMFSSVRAYKDSAERAKSCREKAEISRKDAIYAIAMGLMVGKDVESYELAIKKLESIRGWKDADAKIEECAKKIVEIMKAAVDAKNKKTEDAYNEAVKLQETAKKAKEYTAAAKAFGALGQYRDNAERENACIRMADKAKKKSKISICAVAAAIVALIVLFFAVIKPNMEEKAAAKAAAEARAAEIQHLIEIDAISKIFEEIDSMSEDEMILVAEGFEEKGHYGPAVTVYGMLQDSEPLLAAANRLENKGEYRWAIDAYIKLGDKNELLSAAERMEEKGKYSLAVRAYIQAGSNDKVYAVAESFVESGDNVHAAMTYGKLGDYEDAHAKSFELWDEIAVRDTISAGELHTVGLKDDGTVVAVGYNVIGECDVSELTDIVAISAGDTYTVGLKSDGTVVALGSQSYGRCNVSDWTDIVAISAGYNHTVGLKSDGTAVAVGMNDEGQCDVSGWTDIVAISAGYSHTVGLKADGTAVAVGDNDGGRLRVSDWTDIVAISAGDSHTVGLKADGTVVAVGYNDDGRCDVSDWTDIVAISAGDTYTVGLKADGTVVATEYTGNQKYYKGQCDVAGWADIVAVSAGDSHTVGLKADGTVVAVGNNEDGQCNVSSWRSIKLPR